MFNSVNIGGKDMLLDFGCYLAHKDISAPKPKTHYIAIPLRNGSLDLSEALTGDVKYEDRPITIKLKYLGAMYDSVYSDITNYLDGKRKTIIFDDDPNYYYEGRFEVKSYSNKNFGGYIELTAQCDPFKYAIQSSIDEWEWDTFDFETGYINELSNIAVNGTVNVSLIADVKGFAKITSTASINVTYKGKTVRIGAGTTTMYDFEFTEGENVLTFTGVATVTIDYKGGRL